MVLSRLFLGLLDKGCSEFVVLHIGVSLVQDTNKGLQVARIVTPMMLQRGCPQGVTAALTDSGQLRGGLGQVKGGGSGDPA